MILSFVLFILLIIYSCKIFILSLSISTQFPSCYIATSHLPQNPSVMAWICNQTHVCTIYLVGKRQIQWSETEKSNLFYYLKMVLRFHRLNILADNTSMFPTLFVEGKAIKCLLLYVIYHPSIQLKCTHWLGTAQNTRL
mgnify:FL=1